MKSPLGRNLVESLRAAGSQLSPQAGHKAVAASELAKLGCPIKESSLERWKVARATDLVVFSSIALVNESTPTDIRYTGKSINVSNNG